MNKVCSQTEISSWNGCFWIPRCISTCTNPFCPFTYTSLKQQCVQRVIARVLRLCHRVLQASNNQHRKYHLILCIQLRDILVRKFSHDGSATARTNPRGSPQGFVFVRFDQDGGVSPKLPRYWPVYRTLNLRLAKFQSQQSLLPRRNQLLKWMLLDPSMHFHVYESILSLHLHIFEAAVRATSHCQSAEIVSQGTSSIQ